ncbi:PAS domain-containing sensor histidine kinase [Haloferax namakaokahaiae]|uniref:PAS domain-containing sensor histidine kinase n=1 Tax=Haloferax namakaokahaiae TaxID=1748331 RepID=A0ABD5ZB22_9EURY
MADVSLIERGFDELPTEVALLNGSGDIVYTNRAWRTFAEANEYVGSVDSVGVNYFDVCDAASEEDELAGVVADGIRSILAGQRDIFTAEYPCHSPSVYRWFLLIAVPFLTQRHGKFALVMHLDITDRRLAELQVNEKNQHLTMLMHLFSSELTDELERARELTQKLVEDDGEDARALRETLNRIESVLGRSVALADQTRVVELERVDFRDAATRAWGDLGRHGDVSCRIVGDGTFDADRHLLGLLLASILVNRVEGNVQSKAPTYVVIGTTTDGLYIEDNGTPPSNEQRTIATPAGQLLGVDYESVGLSIASRIADLHGWSFEIVDSELGGIRIEVDGISWE